MKFARLGPVGQEQRVVMLDNGVHLSQFMSLDPGGLQLTGAPEGGALSGRFGARR
jgi:hypothetical protein